MKIDLYEVIQEPLITEKVAKDTEKLAKYAFRVYPKANKVQIRAAIEKIYNVHVIRVNTSIQGGKWRRVRFQPGKTSDWKKAIVTLKKGEKIDVTTKA
ncbi:MAG: 50S ribosomal protein L23 [Candidatus Omnitrophica bacterium]|nr:50S ribosomal protein L23 [Candidatus Omnitrophota bacterium]